MRRISFFAISEKYRENKLGRKLFQSVVDYIKSQNISDFYLFTDTRCNHLFYEHMGFVRYCEKTSN